MERKSEEYRVLLDLSYCFAELSGMAVDTFNIWRVFTQHEKIVPLPMIWDTKAGVNPFIYKLPKFLWRYYIGNLGAPLKAKSSKFIKLMSFLHLILLTFNIEPVALPLNKSQKRELFYRFFSKVLKSPQEHLYLDQTWFVVNPPANIYYEAAKLKVVRMFERMFKIYARRHIELDVDFALYQYPRFLRVKNKYRSPKIIIKVHDLYPIFMEEAVPEGSRTAQTREYALKKIAKEKWDVYIVTPTQYTASRLIQYEPYFKNRTFVVYNNLQTYHGGRLLSREKVLRIVSKKIFANTNIHKKITRYFIQVGTIQPIKNYDLTLNAFERIIKKHPEVALVVVGSYGWKSKNTLQKLEALSKKGVLAHFENIETFLLLSLIKHAEALLFPSKIEGFGLPPIEALMMRTVPIVSDIPVFREVLEKHAVFVKISDYTHLMQAMLNILDRRKHEKIKKAVFKGVEVFLRRYSDEKVALRWLDLFSFLSRKK